MLVGQPAAGIKEVLMKHSLHQTDGVAAGSAAPALELIPLKRQRWVVVFMEAAQCLMLLYHESQSHCHAFTG